MSIFLCCERCIFGCNFPDAEVASDFQDLSAWRELKNRMEREELQRSYEFVPDEFEDTRFAEDEAQRWMLGKPPYSQLIAGVDFLEPTPGIDY